MKSLDNAEHNKEILTDEEQHAKLSANAKKRAELFNQHKVVGDYERFYEEVTQGLYQVS